MINNILDSKNLIILGFVFKLLIGTLFASFVLKDLFIPFVDFFVTNLENPYANFLDVNSPQNFPYPTLMLLILSTPVFLAELFFDLETLPVQVSFSIYRLPLLLADLGILLILSSWIRAESQKRLIWLYWFSPVLFYISYIHGQLDVIPIFLLFLSLNYLFKQNILLSGLILGLAISTKTMVILSLPFIVLLLISKDNSLRNTSIFILSSAICFFLVNLPFIFDPSFQEMVFFNEEQTRIFELSFLIGESSFYFIPACLLLLALRGFLIKTYNRDIFMMFLGFSFGIILMFITPMQGWYFWFIPFLTYFYAKSADRYFILLILLQFAYLLYFSLVENSDYLNVFSLLQSDTSIYLLLTEAGLNPEAYKGIAFTLLQVSLGVNCFFIYRRGIDSYSKHKITSAPYLIGVGGDSGAGKTTISESLSNIFTSMNSLVIRGDDMHKWQRGHEKWEEFTHLDPKANLLHQEIDMLNSLKAGKSILRKMYNHDDGTFSSDLNLAPNNLIIFEGLHAFYLSRQRQIYDVKLFIQPDKDLSDHWKITRDIEKRGYSKEKVLDLLSNREEDSKNYVRSQAKYSDILISPKPINPIKNIGDKQENIDIKYHLLMPNSIFFENLVDNLDGIKGLNVSHNYLDEDKQEIEISGNASKEEISEVANSNITSLVDLGVDYPDWPSSSLGALLVILTFFIFEDANYGKE